MRLQLGHGADRAALIGQLEATLSLSAREASLPLAHIAPDDTLRMDRRARADAEQATIAGVSHAVTIGGSCDVTCDRSPIGVATQQPTARAVPPNLAVRLTTCPPPLTASSSRRVRPRLPVPRSGPRICEDICPWHRKGESRALGLQNAGFGWGTWIRTKIDGVRVRSSTVELFPNRLPTGWRLWRAGGF